MTCSAVSVLMSGWLVLRVVADRGNAWQSMLPIGKVSPRPLYCRGHGTASERDGAPRDDSRPKRGRSADRRVDSQSPAPAEPDAGAAVGAVGDLGRAPFAARKRPAHADRAAAAAACARAGRVAGRARGRVTGAEHGLRIAQRRQAHDRGRRHVAAIAVGPRAALAAGRRAEPPAGPSGRALRHTPARSGCTS